MPVYNGICVYIVLSTDQLTLYSTVYCHIATTKAEYMTMTEVMKEAIWLRGLIDDFGIDQDLLKINYDSISATYLAKNQVYYERMKHIDVKFYFVREILDDGNIKL